ncbi:MAG: glycogen-binding domain-containing protein [Pseudomonadota bacterium]
MKKKQSSPALNRQLVKFTLNAPQAEEVVLVGNFNGWDPRKHPMAHTGNGIWQKLLMLSPGIYEYKFRVDNLWIKDPINQQSCSNCFGTLNSILEISGE